ncbi:MAG: hypothetical protein ACIAQF_04480 [Phycisphaerales bacterium JB065]
MSASYLSDAFETRYGIPQPKWPSVCDLLGDDPQEWGPFLTAWSTRVAAAFGPNGSAFRTERAIVVTDLAPADAERSVRVVQSAVDLIEHMCLPSDHSDRTWPRVFFVVEDRERYYDFAAGGMEAADEFYESVYGAERSGSASDIDDQLSSEEIASAGLCFQSGYVHILASFRRDDYFAETIAHEFAHAANVSRQLPPWLDEGVAELMAARFMYGKQYEARFALDRLAWQDAVNCWKSNGFEAFWTGLAFNDIELSYAAYVLAPRLAINLLERCGEAGFRGFLDSGSWEDDGESAVRSVTGLSLNDFAKAMIGD